MGEEFLTYHSDSDNEVEHLLPADPEDSDTDLEDEFHTELQRLASSANAKSIRDVVHHLQRVLAAVRPGDPMMTHGNSSNYENAALAFNLGFETHRDEHNKLPFAMREFPSKGFGLVASRPIRAGSLLLDEPPLFKILEPSKGHSRNATESDHERAYILVLTQLLEQYTRIPHPYRQYLSTLHAHIPDEMREQWHLFLKRWDINLDQTQLNFLLRLYRTFHTNEFMRLEGRGWKSRWLFPVVSRLNHACVPNCRSTQTTEGRKVITAARDMEAGEELTIQYVDARRFATREEWEAYTRTEWGFVCGCRVCETAGYR